MPFSISGNAQVSYFVTFSSPHFSLLSFESDNCNNWCLHRSELPVLFLLDFTHGAFFLHSVCVSVFHLFGIFMVFGRVINFSYFYLWEFFYGQCWAWFMQRDLCLPLPITWEHYHLGLLSLKGYWGHPKAINIGYKSLKVFISHSTFPWGWIHQQLYLELTF